MGSVELTERVLDLPVDILNDHNADSHFAIELFVFMH